MKKNKNQKTNEYKKLQAKFEYIKKINYNVIQIDDYYFTCSKIVNIVRLLNELDSWITLDPYDPYIKYNHKSLPNYRYHGLKWNPNEIKKFNPVFNYKNNNFTNFIFRSSDVNPKIVFPESKPEYKLISCVTRPQDISNFYNKQSKAYSYINGFADLKKNVNLFNEQKILNENKYGYILPVNLHNYFNEGIKIKDNKLRDSMNIFMRYGIKQNNLSFIKAFYTALLFDNKNNFEINQIRILNTKQIIHNIINHKLFTQQLSQ